MQTAGLEQARIQGWTESAAEEMAQHSHSLVVVVERTGPLSVLRPVAGRKGPRPVREPVAGRMDQETVENIAELERPGKWEQLPGPEHHILGSGAQQTTKEANDR